MKIQTLLSATPVLILSLAAGCGGSGGVDSSTPQSTSITSTGLTIRLVEDRSIVAAGQNVNFTLIITNTSTAPITYLASEGCDNAEEAIKGINSAIFVVGHGSTSPLRLPDPAATCASVGLPVAVTLAPGASITGTVSSGNGITTAGKYDITTAGKYDITASVENLSSAGASTAPLTC